MPRRPVSHPPANSAAVQRWASMDKTSVARRSISAESAVAQDHTESEIDSTRYARAHYDWLLSQRKAGRILQVSGQSVGRWVKKYVDSLPARTCHLGGDQARRVAHFCTNKRYLITAVDRNTRCFMGWSLVECTAIRN